MYKNKLRVLICVFLALAIVSALALAGETGKIRGKITDSQTGEVLIGANVIVVGTSWGGTTDVDGMFVILNVPPGTYTLKASFLGYQSITVSNVKVNADLTTEVKFTLPSEAIAVPTVEIVREAPLINKSATNTVTVITADELKTMPIRGVAQAFALSAGVISQGGDFYVRGGRSEETAFYVDGVLVNNPINGRLSLNVINNAVEEIQAQIGGMTAEYGNGMSGVVSTTTRIGPTKYTGSFEVLTDEIGGSESKHLLGAYSYGRNEYVMTLGGPIIPGDNQYRFFLAGQRIFNRSGVSWQDGIKFPLVFDSTSITSADWNVVNRDTSVGGVKSLAGGTTGNRAYLANLLNRSNYNGGRNLGGIDQDSWGLTGNIFADLGSINIKAGGSYNTNTQIGGFGRGLQVIDYTAGVSRGTKTVTDDAMGYVKFTYSLTPKTLLTANVSYYRWYQQSGDQILWDNIENYGNPNAKKDGKFVNSVLVGPSRNPSTFALHSFTVSWPGAVPANYSKLLRSNIGGRFDFVNQFGSQWELKLGGEVTQYTIRTYNIVARDLYVNRLKLKESGISKSDWYVYNMAQVGFYGYDIYGNEFDGGKFKDKSGTTIPLNEEGPRKPIFLGTYIQNKFEFDDLIMNIGLRYDRLDPGVKRYKDLKNIKLDIVNDVYVPSAASFTDQEITEQFSPRLGFSFPVTDRTVFHATYGKFIQFGRLSDLYDPRTRAGYFFQGGYARQFPTPNLKPERTTQYEVGFRQQLGDVAAFDATFYYKDIKDLHVIRVIFPGPQSQVKAFFANVNGDFGTSKGFTLNFELRRSNRIAIRSNYTFASALATGSTSRTHFDIAWQDNSYGGEAYFPVVPAPTEFDHTHSGTVNIDYRFTNDDGPEMFGVKTLERFGISILSEFARGFRYTRSQIDGAFAFSSTNAPIAYEGMNISETPWTYRMNLKLDKTFNLFDQADLNIYLWIQNVLNTKNIIGVYSGTGEANNDGWFTTETGRSWMQTNGAGAVALYNYLQDNLGFYGNPRTVQLGAMISF